MGMAKYDRLLFILNLLRTRRNLNAAMIAAECGVTERSIYRDVIALSEANIPFVKGKTWTTDAFYRETQAKVALRRKERCLTVEMEAAAFFAVAKFRRVAFAQMLYAGDDVSGLEWDPRRWDKRASVRERLFWLAAEACSTL